MSRVHHNLFYIGKKYNIDSSCLNTIMKIGFTTHTANFRCNQCGVTALAEIDLYIHNEISTIGIESYVRAMLVGLHNKDFRLLGNDHFEIINNNISINQFITLCLDYAIEYMEKCQCTAPIICRWDKNYN